MNTFIDIDILNGFEFQELIASLLRNMGLEVEEMRKTADGGVDAIAISRARIVGGKFIIQCKRYDAKVGEQPVRDLYGTVMHHHASKGVLITNSTFTDPAKTFAENKPIELIDGNDLQELFIQYSLAVPNNNSLEKNVLPTGFYLLQKTLQSIIVIIKSSKDEAKLESGKRRLYKKNTNLASISM